MTLGGFTLPALSAYDPGMEGEGSLDPMGLGAIADRLADRLVPGLRARMSRIRFVTAMAVGAMVCEALPDVISADGMTSPAICFEWLVIESFARRVAPQELPSGVPGSQKARAVVARSQRLSAGTYLKVPTVFGFNGIYKPFGIDSGIVTSDLAPAPWCAELVRAWESDQGFDGFTDSVSGSRGGRLLVQLREGVRAGLLEGRCSTKPNSPLFGDIAMSLHPGRAMATERRVLRSLVRSDRHEHRAELADRLIDLPDNLTESEVLTRIRSKCSAPLRRTIDAVVSYERFAELLDTGFRTLTAISYSMGSQPLTPHAVRDNELLVRCTRELPDSYRRADETMDAIAFDSQLEGSFGEFSIPCGPADLVELLLKHHEHVQAAKDKRSWFEPLRNGWVVRRPYGSAEPPQLVGEFVHPVRVAALGRFVAESAP